MLHSRYLQHVAKCSCQPLHDCFEVMADHSDIKNFDHECLILQQSNECSFYYYRFFWASTCIDKWLFFFRKNDDRWNHTKILYLVYLIENYSQHNVGNGVLDWISANVADVPSFAVFCSRSSVTRSVAMGLIRKCQ